MTHPCPNRKGNPRMALEVCRWHVFGDDKRKPDPLCLKRLGGAGTEFKCEVARKLLKEGSNGSSENNGSN